MILGFYNIFMGNFISSLQNQSIKDLVKLRKARRRKLTEVFLVDGLREIKEAVKSGFIIDKLFCCPELNKEAYNFDLPIIELSEPVFQKVAYPENPDGWLATVRPKKISLTDIQLKKNPLVIILEGVEKPGNVGAIIRTASAVEATAVIINNPKIDIYNPNVIRASTGLIFSTPTIIADKESTWQWLRDHQFTIWATTGQAKKNLFLAKFTGATALVFGTEATGLDSYWLNKADEKLKIPMRPGLDSLNVSVSVAIFAFEVVRQQKFKK